MMITRFLKRIGVVPAGGPRLRSIGKLIVLAGAVGVVAGLGAIAFHWLCNFVVHHSLDWVAGYHTTGPRGEGELFAPHATGFSPWLLLAVLTAGGLVSGWLVFTFAPEAEGHGTDAAIDAYHNKRGVIRPRVPLIKMLSSAITIGTGGSGGREGPIAQIGAGFGSLLATRLKLTDHERRVLLAAGMGAGIGAIFRAPLAGAIFSIEVLYRDPDFEAEALIPSFISTTVAYCVFCLHFGFAPLFDVGAVKFDNPLLLAPLTVLAVVMVFASLLYVKCFYGVNRLFKRLRIPRHFKPAIGALLTGLLAVGLYYATASLGRDLQKDSLSVLSFGYGLLQKIFETGGRLGADLSAAIVILLVVGLGKILTTSLTIGSGGSGGVFGPSMVIGGALGGVVGLAFQQWMPGVVTRVDVFVILGMASFFAAAANTPVSTLIMVSEMTASYALMLPAMWVCALAYLLARGWTIYKEQVPSRLDSPAHRGDFVVDVLEGLTVRDAWKPSAQPLLTVPLETPLSEVVRALTGTTQSAFAVVDSAGSYYGLFSINDVRRFLYDSEVGALAVAQDLARTNIRPLTMDTDLSNAMKQLAVLDVEELAVVDAPDAGHVVGMLRRRDIIAAYNARLVEMRSGE